MNKTEKVKNHLETIGHITSLEAINEYGATRLSAIIYNLRHHYNMEIRNETVFFIDRFGNKSHYDVYIYEGDDKNE